MIPGGRYHTEHGSIDLGLPKPAGADAWHWSWSGHDAGFTRLTLTPEALEELELHRAILALDPDPEAPMPNTLEHDGVTLTARSAEDVAALIAAVAADPTTAPFMQRAREGEGTGTLGLYIEAVSFDADGQPFSHMRFFVVSRHLYAYNRSAGDTRANWRHREADSLEAALTIMQTAINKESVKVWGHPVLVELTPADLSAVETGNIPASRFRAQSRIDRDFGRYDFEMPVVSKPLPDALAVLLR